MAKFVDALKGAVAVAIALALSFGAGYYVGGLPEAEPEPVTSQPTDLKLPTESEKRVVTVEQVEAKLVETAELSTYSQRYTVTRSVDYTRYLVDRIPIPGTTNSVTLTCEGIVKVGYDVHAIQPLVDNDSQTIYISLPAPAVNDNYIIWDSVEYSEKNNLFNPIDFEQYRTLINEIEDMGLERAEEEGIYEAAEENIKLVLTNFLAGFEDYKVVFL